MQYQEIIPAPLLRQHVRCYYMYASDSSMAFEDTVFPSGGVEIVFNLGDGQWQTDEGDGFVTTPSIELWGQITRPLPVKSVGRNTMLGIRFFPHAAARFLDDNVELFNNQVLDYGYLSGTPVKDLHQRLLETNDWKQRIALLDHFLLQKISQSASRHQRMDMLGAVMQELRRDDFFDNIENVALRHGISARYLQKIFLQYSGLTPKLYSKINRFRQSLGLVEQQEASLTSIAYACGYADQSHFIREFRAFTGKTPSMYAAACSPITLAISKT
ncbi:MAG: helix-turn-helix transcriptional regulator [Bacteroidetes bacterium]|nr:helix-turn-helix transcriptional regulator [Bacteroidota bacterium]